MNSLLSNKCIKYVNISKDSTESIGEIGFYGGEIYEGEIENSQPNGWGILQLPNGSYYEGNFDINGMTDGRFVLFNGDYFDGKFLKDKMYKGTLYFADGDSIEGEWGNERMKWCLKHGLFRDENRNSLVNFSKELKVTNKASKDKEVYKAKERGGFEIKYQSVSLMDETNIHNLSYTADGVVNYEKLTGDGTTERVEIHLTSVIPFTKIEYYNNRSLKKKIHKMCFGFDIETKLGTDNHKITFRDLKDIYGLGIFKFEKNEFKFKGNLNYRNEELGQLSLKKSSFIDLKVKFNGIIYESMGNFCTYIAELCNEKFNDGDVYVNTVPEKKIKSETKPEIIGDVINDIKSHNNCVIM